MNEPSVTHRDDEIVCQHVEIEAADVVIAARYLASTADQIAQGPDGVICFNAALSLLKDTIAAYNRACGK
jgi:hypothetical protein